MCVSSLPAFLFVVVVQKVLTQLVVFGPGTVPLEVIALMREKVDSVQPWAEVSRMASFPLPLSLSVHGSGYVVLRGAQRFAEPVLAWYQLLQTNVASAPGDGDEPLLNRVSSDPVVESVTSVEVPSVPPVDTAGEDRSALPLPPMP